MNSQPKTPAISHWLEWATDELKKAATPSPRLDAEIILAHTLRKPRTYLHTHASELLDPRMQEVADARLLLRLDRTPIAYIVGHKEFYGRQFKVTPSTLIPRPESEAMITLLKKWIKKAPGKKLVDVGTGTGCLGITAKLEHPELDVTLTDLSRHALHVAQWNAAHHKATVSLLHSDLLEKYPFTADIILANLPYVDKKWQRSPETNHEPAEALFASNGGLHIIGRLLAQTASQLATGGIIFIEADPRQHEAITHSATAHNLSLCETEGFILTFQKS